MLSGQISGFRDVTESAVTTKHHVLANNKSRMTSTGSSLGGSSPAAASVTQLHVIVTAPDLSQYRLQEQEQLQLRVTSASCCHLIITRHVITAAW